MLQPLIVENNLTMTNYEKGLVFSKQNMPGLAIKSFKKSISSEEPNIHKAYYELSKIYLSLNDFDSAYTYCMESIKQKSNFIDALYYLVHILSKTQIPISDMQYKIESLFPSTPLDYGFIADIFYIERHYDTALIYIKKYEEKLTLTDNLKLLKVKCILRLCKYKECIQYINTITEDSLYYFKIMMYKVLCLILCGEYNLAGYLLDSLSKNTSYNILSNYNQKVLNVYIQLHNIFTSKSTSILTEDESDVHYASCIFEICELLLATKEFDSFEKSLELLNLTNDKSVLLQLGKLYYKYGYMELAKNEIIRSISLFDVISSDSLEILSSYLNKDKNLIFKQLIK